MKCNPISAAALLVAFGALAPAANAQAVRNLFNNPCCNVCGHTVCTCSKTRPVIETRMRQQNCLTYQDRKRIVCKTEPVCETVPVTKVDCVTVDEGCYQMVWVPRPVTKAVPRTEMHQRMSYRQVPVEICEKVPVMTTQLVPEQTIRYVTEHVHVTTTAPVPLCPPAGPICPPTAGPACTPGGMGIPSVVPGAYGGVRGGFGGLHGVGPATGPGGGGNYTPAPIAIPYSVMNDQPAPGTVAATTVSAPATAGLVPDARYAEPAAQQNWTSVPPRNAVNPAPQKYAEAPAGGSRNGKFVSPSTTASVFQPRRPVSP